MTKSQKLRQRNQQMLRSMASDQLEERRVNEISAKATTKANNFFLRFYIVLGTAIIVTIFAILSYTRPRILFGKKQISQPTYELATLYPPNLVLDRDLPRFFRTYSIATKQNAKARAAVKRIAKSRMALKRNTGNLNVNLKSWDSRTTRRLAERGICGADFNTAYRKSSENRREKLIMWCVLATRATEGFFLREVEFFNNAFIVARRRGMVVQSAYTGFKGFLHNFYLHPRKGEKEDQFAQMPLKVLDWLMSNPEDFFQSDEEEREMIQNFIYTLLQAPQFQDRYLVLKEVCQTTTPGRAIGKYCFDKDDCCFFVVPEHEGGIFGEPHPSDTY